MQSMRETGNERETDRKRKILTLLSERKMDSVELPSGKPLIKKVEFYISIDEFVAFALGLIMGVSQGNFFSATDDPKTALHYTLVTM